MGKHVFFADWRGGSWGCLETLLGPLGLMLGPCWRLSGTTLEFCYANLGHLAVLFGRSWPMFMLLRLSWKRPAGRSLQITWLHAVLQDGRRPLPNKVYSPHAKLTFLKSSHRSSVWIPPLNVVVLLPTWKFLNSNAWDCASLPEINNIVLENH